MHNSNGFDSNNSEVRLLIPTLAPFQKSVPDEDIAKVMAVTKVVQVEDTRLAEKSADGKGEKTVEILVEPSPGLDIRWRRRESYHIGDQN